MPVSRLRTRPSDVMRRCWRALRGPLGASVCIHAALLVAIAWIRVGNDIAPDSALGLDAVLVNSPRPIEQPPQEVIQSAPQFEVVKTKTQSTSKTTSNPTVGVARPQVAIDMPSHSLTTSALTWDQALASNWHDSDLIAKFDPIGAAVGQFKRGGASNGSGRGTGTGNGIEFFGLDAPGKRFVYVIDASKSMNRPHDSDAGTRFRRVKLELVKSIGNLPESAQFFILFFNDYAVTMPAPGLEPASNGAKLKYLQWMQQVTTSGNTEPTAAFALALKLKPDVIYFLSDGDFNSRVRQEMLELPASDTVVQSFAFEEALNEDMQRAFDLLTEKKPLAAQKAARGNEYRKALAAWRGQTFLRDLSQKHGGKLVLIP